jgi:hypothetical protein
MRKPLPKPPALPEVTAPPIFPDDAVPVFRKLPSLAAVLAYALTAAAPVQAQTIDRGLETEIVREFMTLELAGWRLPDPLESCLTGLSLQRLEPMAFGSTEMIDQPELVDPPGPHYRVVRIDPEGGDRRRRLARIEWLLPGPGGAPEAKPDSFVFVVNDVGGDRGAASMVREPAMLVIRRECFG